VIHPHRLKREGREQRETIPVKTNRRGTCPWFIPWKKGEGDRAREEGREGGLVKPHMLA